MNKKSEQNFPYKPLGVVLKRLREKHRQSLAEVSGAVEIDVTLLTNIEQGSERPSEDILLLLISHFSIRDEDASKLWELAGYLRSQSGSDDFSFGPAANNNGGNGPQAVYIMPMDIRIVYTDIAHVAVNKFGITMNFMQSGGLGNKPLAVSRIGMSREHAESVLELLQQALHENKPRLLPGPEPADDTDSIAS